MDEADDSFIAKTAREIQSFRESIFHDADQNIKQAQARQKKNYDKRHALPTFSIGDKVLKKIF